MNGLIEPLSAGTVAPDFSLPRGLRVSTSLHDVHGRPMILVFYPLDWETVSAQQLALYQDYLVEFERLGASVLGISVDHAWSHAAFAHDLRIRFLLLSDSRPKGAVARTYGVYRESQEVSARALFVVDPGGIIRFSQAYPDLLNPGVNDILTTLELMAANDNSTGAQPRADRSGAPAAKGEGPMTLQQGPVSLNSGTSKEMRGDALRPVHDLKQEMTVVRGYTQLLTEFAQQDGAQLDERIRKALERLDASTTHMTALLDQALRASDGSHTR